MQHPEARIEGLVVQELLDEVLVYDLDRHKARCLNSTAAGVWKKCDGERTVSQIAGELSSEWKVPVTEDLVWVTLDKLGRAMLLKGRMQQPASRSAIPRREMMRRLKVGALVAVPLVASILVPTALASSSPLPQGAACVEGVQCGSEVCFNMKCL